MLNSSRLTSFTALVSFLMQRGLEDWDGYWFINVKRSL